MMRSHRGSAGFQPTVTGVFVRRGDAQGGNGPGVTGSGAAVSVRQCRGPTAGDRLLGTARSYERQGRASLRTSQSTRPTTPRLRTWGQGELLLCQAAQFVGFSLGSGLKAVPNLPTE